MSKIIERRESQNVPVAQQELEARTMLPPVDIYENTDKFVLIADMPGLTVDTINVSLERDQLNLEGSSELPGLEPLRYQRTFRVMKGLDPAAITATYNQGVLTVNLPKPESHRPRNITVTAG